MGVLSLTRISVTIIESASQGRVASRTGVASNVNRRLIIAQIVVIGRDRFSTGLTSTSIEMSNDRRGYSWTRRVHLRTGEDRGSADIEWLLMQQKKARG